MHALGDRHGERETLFLSLDGGRARRAETLEHEEGEELLCALMGSSVASSGTEWFSLQEKLDQRSLTIPCDLESGIQFRLWLLCSIVGYTEQWGPGRTPVIQNKQYQKI
jgi:hypothetical protein